MNDNSALYTKHFAKRVNEIYAESYKSLERKYQEMIVGIENKIEQAQEDNANLDWISKTQALEIIDNAFKNIKLPTDEGLNPSVQQDMVQKQDADSDGYSNSIEGKKNGDDCIPMGIKQNNIVIQSPSGKTLRLDFEDKLEVSGDMEMDEAAIIFIDTLKNMWVWNK